KQHLGCSTRGRQRAPFDEFSGTNVEPAVLARWKMDRIQRRVRGQLRRLRRARGWWRAKTFDVASGRGPRGRLDARRQVDPVFLQPRDLGAERRATLLDGVG